MPENEPQTPGPEEPTQPINPSTESQPEQPASPADQAEAQPSTDQPAQPSAEAKEALKDPDDPANSPAASEVEKPKVEGPAAEVPKEQGGSPDPSSEAPSSDPVPQNPSSVKETPQGPVNTNPPPNYPDCFIDIKFQERPIGEVGVNGCQLEDVLAMCQKRLESFQVGPMKCLENDKAISYVHNAIKWLERRTSLRKMQHVEGSNMPHNSTT